MTIGLLYEGTLDEKPLEVIIEKVIGLVGRQGVHNIKFISRPASGSIEGYIKSSAILFYDTYNCNLAFFIADTDGDDKKISRIRASVSKHCRKINSSSVNVVGCPDPELEQWLIDEENAIKQVFSLPSVKPLPFNEIAHPKERLQKIISIYNRDITVTRSELYAKVVNLMNLDKLRMNSPSFKSFYNSIQKAI